MSATNANRWVIFQPARTHYLDLKAQNFENPIFIFVCFSLKKVYNSFKLQKLLQVAKFSFMHSFTHTNIVSLFRHLPTVIFIFIKVFTRWIVSMAIVLPLLGAGFANILPTLWFYVKFKQGIQRHWNILNSRFETIYQVPRQVFGFVLNMMLVLILLILSCAA